MTLLFLLVLTSFVSHVVRSFVITAGTSPCRNHEGNRRAPVLFSVSGSSGPPEIHVLGVSEEDQLFQNIRNAFLGRGFSTVRVVDSLVDSPSALVYAYRPATGLMQLVSTTTNDDFPRWVPLVNDMESVLINNGWSFLDPDESEPMSAFDVDAANEEGTYKPKWGQDSNGCELGSSEMQSTLGFDLSIMSSDDISMASLKLPRESQVSLLEGATDPPGTKLTSNASSFAGAAGQTDIAHGIFVCAIGSLPLFSTLDLLPTTGSSGWLSFSGPLAEDHVIHVLPDQGATDQRIEVLCAKSRCHLGHFFGSDGYCINASALKFIPEICDPSTEPIGKLISWRQLESSHRNSARQLFRICKKHIRTQKVILCAGCFWHIEAAIRRLPGVVETTVGYTGGSTKNPSYEDVCRGNTGHAEAVLVEFDPEALVLRTLIDAFLSMHDPTKVRAHGKHAMQTGQYRSLIVVQDEAVSMEIVDVLDICRKQLNKDLSTTLKKAVLQMTFSPQKSGINATRKKGQQAMGLRKTHSLCRGGLNSMAEGRNQFLGHLKRYSIVIK